MAPGAEAQRRFGQRPGGRRADRSPRRSAVAGSRTVVLVLICRPGPACCSPCRDFHLLRPRPFAEGAPKRRRLLKIGRRSPPARLYVLAGFSSRWVPELECLVSTRRCPQFVGLGVIVAQRRQHSALISDPVLLVPASRRSADPRDVSRVSGHSEPVDETWLRFLVEEVGVVLTSYASTNYQSPE